MMTSAVVSQSHGERNSLCNRPFPDDKAPIVPHPTDCTKYLECHWEGYFYEKQCADPELTKFDPISTWCVEKAYPGEC